MLNLKSWTVLKHRWQGVETILKMFMKRRQRNDNKSFVRIDSLLIKLLVKC